MSYHGLSLIDAISLLAALGSLVAASAAVIQFCRSEPPTLEELERWEQRSLSWPTTSPVEHQRLLDEMERSR